MRNYLFAKQPTWKGWMRQNQDSSNMSYIKKQISFEPPSYRHRNEVQDGELNKIKITTYLCTNSADIQ
jgi:hypothetical protein